MFKDAVWLHDFPSETTCCWHDFGIAIHHCSHVWSISVYPTHRRRTGGTRLPQDAGCKCWSLATSRINPYNVGTDSTVHPVHNSICFQDILCMRYVMDISTIKFNQVFCLEAIAQRARLRTAGSKSGGSWALGCGCASSGFQRSQSSKNCWKVCTGIHLAQFGL